MAVNIQFSRLWCFTLFDYQDGYDYKSHIDTFQHIKRAVLGYEICEGTRNRHIQGFVELYRSERLSYLRTILPTASWRIAVGSVKSNYEYCVKQGRYQTIGNFDDILNVSHQLTKKQHSIPNGPILLGLMNNDTQMQIKVMKQYSIRQKYFISEAKCLKNLRDLNQDFQKYENVKNKQTKFIENK